MSDLLKIILLIALTGALWLAAELAGFAQSPAPAVCLYTPEQIARTNPAGRQILVHVRGVYGWPQPVEAVAFIRSTMTGARRPEAVAAAIQYSILANPLRNQAAQASPLRAYLPEAGEQVPDVSLYAAVWGHLWLGSPLERDRLGYWLGQAMASQSNQCNFMGR